MVLRQLIKVANVTPRQAVVGGGGVAAAIALIVPFIAQHEGHVTIPYKDIGGVLTVCDGHTGRDIVVKRVYTDQECQQLLDKDVQTATDGVLKVSPELANKPYVLASTISFSYNLGVGTYQRSSVARDFKSGQYKLGCTDMLKYIYAAGKYNKGLANRRQAEYTICMKGT